LGTLCQVSQRNDKVVNRVQSDNSISHVVTLDLAGAPDGP
jgi:hypothetical protein